MQQDKTNPHRLGPRPLPLHLATINMTWMSSRAALPSLKNGSFSWSPSLKAEADQLCDAIAPFSEDTFRAALDAEAYLRGCAFLKGVKAYHRHPYVRDVIDPPSIWQVGNTRILDYGGAADGPVMLAVPSLINKAFVLDLTQKRSLMRSMAKAGIRSFLLDWGDVGEAEKHMGLEDYVLGRLKEAVEEIHRQTNKPVALVGYCMGGVLTTALCALSSEKISALVLLATPWDFHAGEGNHKQVITASRGLLETTINLFGLLPVDAIQTLFAAIDPYSILQKFADFSKLDPDSEAAKKFVAMEDWLNDGVALAGPIAKECLFDWYVENRPALGCWEMDGHYIDPAEIDCPTLLFVPQKDRIVVPQSAHYLGQLIPKAEVRKVDAGHIGMVTGRLAQSSLYSPLAKWLLSNGS